MSELYFKNVSNTILTESNWLDILDAMEQPVVIIVPPQNPMFFNINIPLKSSSKYPNRYGELRLNMPNLSMNYRVYHNDEIPHVSVEMIKRNEDTTIVLDAGTGVFYQVETKVFPLVVEQAIKTNHEDIGTPIHIIDFKLPYMSAIEDMVINSSYIVKVLQNEIKDLKKRLEQ